MRSRYIQNDILAYLQDYKQHTMQEICNELEISRSTCIRHLNDLSLHFNIQTFVGGRNGGVKLIGRKEVNIDYLSDDELQLIIDKLGSLQEPNIQRLVKNLSRQIEKENTNYDRKLIG